MADGTTYAADDVSRLADDVFGGKLGVKEALQKLRNRLLDLSMRNRLLNYRYPKHRSIQFVDSPNLNLLFERLEEGKSVRVAYIPDPSTDLYEAGKKPDVRTHARTLGIDLATHFPPSKEASPNKRLPPLQVLLYPADLERLLRKLSTEARTVIEETGTNMLYLMFGVLEYYDTEESEKPVLAPLLSMPVSLVNGGVDPESRTYAYDLTYTGEDVSENFTLREKLKQFHLNLPQLDLDAPVEAYFKSIERAIEKRAKWKVTRRLTLGFLSFGKLAIWADLDPDDEQAFLESPLLKEVFEGQKNGGGAFHAEDYAIDSHPDGDLPLIYDADSSQHSAIIDVKAGKSLVINGPPGTGKSQTITNIIASAMEQGKKVLFVSEKLAALEVVKKRLEHAGLGEFCLELHSHKTQKKQFIEGIQRRIGARYRSPAGYEERLALLQDRKRKLNAYAQLLGSKLGNELGLTIHQVFWKTERHRQELGAHAPSIDGISIRRADSWTTSDLERARNIASEMASALQALGCSPKDCPWKGYYPPLLTSGDEREVIDLLRRAHAHAVELDKASETLSSCLAYGQWHLSELQSAVDALPVLESARKPTDLQLVETMFRGAVAQVRSTKAVAASLRAELGLVQQLKAEAAQSVSCIDSPLDVQTEQIIAEGFSLLTDSSASFGPDDLRDRVWTWDAALKLLAAAIGDRSVRWPHDTTRLSEALAWVATLPNAVRVENELAPSLLKLSQSAVTVATRFRHQFTLVAQILKDNGVAFGGQVEELQALIDGRGLPELLPDAVLDEAVWTGLREIEQSGWSQWTAAQCHIASREVAEAVTNASSALDDLNAFLNRLGLPPALSEDGLASVETLATIAEGTPEEVMPLRTSGLTRADFGDVAIRAEEAHKAVMGLQVKVAAILHLESLPDEVTLSNTVMTFRQGESLLNIFRADWRSAKKLYRGCTKGDKKARAAQMEEAFALALRWRKALSQYTTNESFGAVLGAAFRGLDTDFGKVRRLYEWYRAGSAALLSSDFSGTFDLAIVPEQHLGLIKANAPRLRKWVAIIRAMSAQVRALPKMDPALMQVRNLADLSEPLRAYGAKLASAGVLLDSVVRAGVTAERAAGLLRLKARISEHGDLLRTLIGSPSALFEAANELGLADLPLQYRTISDALDRVEEHTNRIRDIAAVISREVGDGETIKTTRQVLMALEAAKVACDGCYLSGGRHSEYVAEWVTLGNSKVTRLLKLCELLRQWRKEGKSIQEILDGISKLRDSRRRLESIASRDDFTELFGDKLQGLGTDLAAIDACIAWGEAIEHVAKLWPRKAVNALLTHAGATRVPEVVATLRQVKASNDEYVQCTKQIADTGRIDWSEWRSGPTAREAGERFSAAAAAAGILVPWSKYLAAKEEAETVGIAQVVKKAESQALPHENLVAAVEYVVYRSLSKAILSEHRQLARFSGASHEKLRSEFAEVDRDVIRLTGGIYASRIDRAKAPLPGIGAGRAGDLTEMALLSKETNKQKRHIPIRQLMKRAGKSLQELKPCFMMGPLAVAQYLEREALRFDLVVMDEASQLRPEDALGAIARGKQLVVVGDPKQLPPTNFFDRLVDGDDEDEEDATPAVVEGVESILGICEHIYRPVRTLRWHYRSRHESLIAFSNANFYDDRLIVFPSAYRKSRKRGVNYCFVAEGVYKERRNFPEASRVVNAVVEHMLRFPEQSLGVVTLNQTQRELIEDLFDKVSRETAGVASYLERHEQEGWGFFIKNLENVQGDERDVIFISTTFGKAPGMNDVRQTFGPINRPDGWRRLNVLFTRARHRVDVFTSLRPQDVRLEPGSSLGRRAFHDYLEFAQTSVLPARTDGGGIREPDSDFEVAVAQALMEQGYEVQPQIGVAGFFIDLGVRHPERPGEFLAGIECDGATYHSSLSARDRDRIRQEVLESLGWRGRIVRVWSTDWFENPGGQVERLVAFLEERIAKDSAEPATDDEWTGADVDEQVPHLQRSADSDAELLTSKIEEAPFDRDLFVEVGDEVTYVMLEAPDQRNTVRIVDSESNLRMALINEYTPLALALIGLAVGDEGELHVDGHPPRKLRVLKIRQSVME
jgi:transcription elongation GreA/GreB family factor/very-short-patch-repair endonuclease